MYIATQHKLSKKEQDMLYPVTTDTEQVRAYMHNDMLYAVDGTHRLYAGAKFGTMPKIVIIDDDVTIVNEDGDIIDLDYTLSDILDKKIFEINI
jgi:hypothetical protein